MSPKPSRPVTRCLACGTKFTASRVDARYCSAACRQRAHRSRNRISDLDREIEQTRLHFWKLMYEKARANGVDVSEVLTECAQYVDIDGNVYLGGLPGAGGRYAGRTTPDRSGWSASGLEAAGPPWLPPVDNKGRVTEPPGARR